MAVDNLFKGSWSVNLLSRRVHYAKGRAAICGKRFRFLVDYLPGVKGECEPCLVCLKVLRGREREYSDALKGLV